MVFRALKQTGADSNDQRDMQISQLLSSSLSGSENYSSQPWLELINY